MQLGNRTLEMCCLIGKDIQIHINVYIFIFMFNRIWVVFNVEETMLDCVR